MNYKMYGRRFANIINAQLCASFGVGVVTGYFGPKLFTKKQTENSTFEELSKVTPTIKQTNTPDHAHTHVLNEANQFFDTCVKNDKEASFSMVVLKNANPNVDKMWVTFYQASDNKQAVSEMKNITEEQLKKYYSQEPNSEVIVTEYTKE